MPAGRPRKPTSHLKLHGNYRADRHGDRADEPQPKGAPEMPSHLKGDARLLWCKVVPQLVGAGMAKSIDAYSLASMCEWYRQYRKTLRAIDRIGANHKDHYKLLIQLNMASNNFDRLAAKFGMTPVDRTRLKNEKPDTEEKGLGATARKRG